MTISRSDDLLVGIIALAVVPWALWIVRRGVRDGSLPIGRSYVRRDERAAPFIALLGLYCVAACLMLFVAIDLISGSVTLP